MIMDPSPTETSGSGEGQNAPGNKSPNPSQGQWVKSGVTEGTPVTWVKHQPEIQRAETPGNSSQQDPIARAWHAASSASPAPRRVEDNVVEGSNPATPQPSSSVQSMVVEEPPVVGTSVIVINPEEGANQQHSVTAMTSIPKEALPGAVHHVLPHMYGGQIIQSQLPHGATQYTMGGQLLDGQDVEVFLKNLDRSQPGFAALHAPSEIVQQVTSSSHLITTYTPMSTSVPAPAHNNYQTQGTSYQPTYEQPSMYATSTGQSYNVPSSRSSLLAQLQSFANGPISAGAGLPAATTWQPSSVQSSTSQAQDGLSRYTYLSTVTSQSSSDQRSSATAEYSVSDRVPNGVAYSYPGICADPNSPGWAQFVANGGDDGTRGMPVGKCFPCLKAKGNLCCYFHFLNIKKKGFQYFKFIFGNKIMCNLQYPLGCLQETIFLFFFQLIFLELCSTEILELFQKTAITYHGTSKPANYINITK